MGECSVVTVVGVLRSSDFMMLLNNRVFDTKEVAFEYAENYVKENTNDPIAKIRERLVAKQSYGWPGNEDFSRVALFISDCNIECDQQTVLREGEKNGPSH